jgi:biopolymer transport protein ExbD
VLPAKLAKGKTYSINAKNKQNLAVNVKAAGKCSVTKIYKKISGKNVLQSFKVTAAKQVGTCKLTITSPANNVYKAFSQTKNIAIK